MFWIKLFNEALGRDIELSSDIWNSTPRYRIDLSYEADENSLIPSCLIVLNSVAVSIID